MTASEGGWSWEQIDEVIAGGGADLHLFVAGLLGVEVEDAGRFVRIRRALLAGRADRDVGGEGLTEAGLGAAGVRARDIVAYLRVAERVEVRRCREGGIAM